MIDLGAAGNPGTQVHHQRKIGRVRRASDMIAKLDLRLRDSDSGIQGSA
jgi:hypothetical protein